jgi:hypothetical protein
VAAEPEDVAAVLGVIVYIAFGPADLRAGRFDDVLVLVGTPDWLA